MERDKVRSFNRIAFTYVLLGITKLISARKRAAARKSQ